jgi:integrase
VNDHSTDATTKNQRKRALRGSRGVYKRGGVWVAVVEYPRDPKTGKRVCAGTEGFPTRREAEAERDRIRNEVRSGVDTAPQKLTVAVLLDRWLASKSGLSPTTRQRYGGLIERVKPHLGSMLAAKLRPAHVAELYTTLLSRCRLCTQPPRCQVCAHLGRPRATPPPDHRCDRTIAKHRCTSALSSTSVAHVHALLGNAFAWGVRMQILARSPLLAIGADAPRRAPSKIEAFSDADIAALLDAARGTRWDAAIMLALATGARRGELAALLWNDVTIEAGSDAVARGTLAIRKAFVETKAGGIELKSTKTERERTIPLSSLAMDALQRQRFRQSEDAFRAQEAYGEQGFVFADPLGAPLRPFAFTDAFRKIARCAGVRKRLHDARHTACSHLLAAGVDVVTAATILGHSSPHQTLKTYAHVLAGLKEDAIAKLDGRLRAALGERAGGQDENRGQRRDEG